MAVEGERPALMSDSDSDSQDECPPQMRPFVMAERSRPDLRMFWRPPLAYAQEGGGGCLVIIRAQLGLRAFNALAQADRWWGRCQKWIKLHDKAIVEGRPGLIGRWVPNISEKHRGSGWGCLGGCRTRRR